MSLIDIEKNDVDISKLFAYKKEITLLVPGTTDEVTLYQRVVGDADNNKARVYALRESGKLRENLRNPKWENRQAYLPNIDKMKKADIVELTVALELPTIYRSIINDVVVPVPKEISGDASLEEQEKYQKEVDLYKEKFTNEANRLLGEKLEEKKKTYNKLLKDELIRFYENSVIDQVCQQKFTDCYLEMVTYYGTFSDENLSKRTFKSFDDFLDTPTSLKSRLVESYSSLQIGGATLKKLQGVTP